MTRFFLRMLAVICWWAAIVAIVGAAVDYNDTLRYVLGGVGLALAWIGVCCWFGCGTRRKATDRCAVCEHFADHSSPDDEPDEPNGYCCHPDHKDALKSPHADYGGHWTHSESWCSWFTRLDDTEAMKRSANRAEKGQL